MGSMLAPSLRRTTVTEEVTTLSSFGNMLAWTPVCATAFIFPPAIGPSTEKGMAWSLVKVDCNMPIPILTSATGSMLKVQFLSILVHCSILLLYRSQMVFLKIFSMFLKQDKDRAYMVWWWALTAGKRVFFTWQPLTVRGQQTLVSWRAGCSYWDSAQSCVGNGEELWMFPRSAAGSFLWRWEEHKP